MAQNYLLNTITFLLQYCAQKMFSLTWALRLPEDINSNVVVLLSLGQAITQETKVGHVLPVAAKCPFPIRPALEIEADKVFLFKGRTQKRKATFRPLFQKVSSSKFENPEKMGQKIDQICF